MTGSEWVALLPPMKKQYKNTYRNILTALDEGDETPEPAYA